MDLSKLKESLAEKEAARVRVGVEADELRRQLSTISKAARAAEHRSEETTLLAVIDPSLSADAEAAKEVLVEAFRRETEARDRQALLDRVIRVLSDEIAALEAQLPGVANAKVGEVITAALDEIDEQLVQVAARLYARARALDLSLYEITDMVADRLEGNGVNRLGLRGRVLEAAAKVRAEITGVMP